MLSLKQNISKSSAISSTEKEYDNNMLNDIKICCNTRNKSLGAVIQ